MSLLIPTAQDYKDARAGYDLLPAYRESLEQRRHEKTDEGKPKFGWEFSVEPGFFHQSDDSTDDLNFNYATHDFGRKEPWDELTARLARLNGQSATTKYKLLFLARHGQGFHNVIVSKYGSAEWHRKWHRLGRDGDVEYAPDPRLTRLGEAQGRENHAVWRAQLAAGCPLPTRYVASPLQRSCNTLLLTMGGLWPENTAVEVVESVREIIGYHLCNKRSTKTQILERFSSHGFVTEPGFTEEDELYTEQEEKFDDMCFRMNGFLQRAFDEWDDSVLNVTSHGGTIKCLLAVVGHRNFTISTGGMIPVVVKATRTQERL
ncbi:putative phosphoglycerate mutase pmu1 [Yamadazyma tenuis]|uniref:Phosphoglycerate mutase-like protein n=1 Tax=Candida tenuis (strain ATCC 10573 / BCRC 21748 / CBS 615 / JCM 9827 / NBRC 10315 / NRRL Y-1498 / VKM Y-70) TaxID=590646 RepID=G3B8Z9_CANTC|nr:uncharacterized protein CANTEDRAFT_131301 [Yamadazyma tenuis ATCC 10573]EGV61817.1 hypothetical protein CANTEDRAFT_131301 [Yamadazyma tenuis ATCC 10573]WEJ93043.1 putative phosphoglycerate mutase pmu1 [Yamadazyma tenuis]